VKSRASLQRSIWLLLSLVASTACAAGFDTPESAMRALQQAYIHKNADEAVAALDFTEEGRQLLQETNPLQANDPDSIKRTAELLETSFRNDLRTKGFPDFDNLTCSFSGKVQIAPSLIRLTEKCVAVGGGQSVQELMAMKRDDGWRVVLASPVF
jgi:hypothetical protein